MKKTLMIMWLIILIGGTFLVFHFLNKPDTSVKPPIQVQDKVSLEDAFESEDFSENITLGDKALENKDYLRAIKYYSKAAKLDPSSDKALSKLAETYLQNSESEKAKEVVLQALTLNPSNQNLQIQLVRAQINTRQIEAAQAIIDQINPENNERNYYQSIIQIINEQFDSAEETLNKIAENPGTNEEILKKTKIFLKAFESFSYYKEGDPSFLQLLMAKALVDNKEFEASIPLLKKIITNNNNYRDAWIVFGYAYLNTNNPPEAIDALKQAKDLDPEKPETLYFLGLSYFANDQILEAINYIEKADKAGYEPKEQINLKLGDLYLIQEQYQKASAKYQQVLSKNKNNLELYVRTVWLNIEKTENYDVAFAVAQDAAKNFPDEAMSYNLLGWAFTAEGDYDNAKANLDKSLAINPDLDITHLNIAWLYQKQNSNALAKEYYKKAYILGQGNTISNLAAERFNGITAAETNRFYQVNISKP